MLNRDETTAIHEAGHVIAFYRLGLSDGFDGGGVSIVPKDDTAGRHRHQEILFYGEGELSEDEIAVFHKAAIHACAGYAAVLAAGYSEEEASQGCESDFEFAERHGDVAEFKEEALQLMQQDANVAAIRRLADELLRRGCVDEQHLDVLIDEIDGKITAEEYQRYLVLSGLD